MYDYYYYVVCQLQQSNLAIGKVSEVLSQSTILSHGNFIHQQWNVCTDHLEPRRQMSCSVSFVIYPSCFSVNQLYIDILSLSCFYCTAAAQPYHARSPCFSPVHHQLRQGSQEAQPDWTSLGLSQQVRNGRVNFFFSPIYKLSCKFSPIYKYFHVG